MGPEMQAGASGPAQARLKVQTVQHFSVAEAPMYDTVCENRLHQQTTDFAGPYFCGMKTMIVFCFVFKTKLVVLPYE